MQRSTSSTSEAATGDDAGSGGRFFLGSLMGLLGVWATAQPTTPAAESDEMMSTIRNIENPRVGRDPAGSVRHAPRRVAAKRQVFPVPPSGPFSGSCEVDEPFDSPGAVP